MIDLKKMWMSRIFLSKFNNFNVFFKKLNYNIFSKLIYYDYYFYLNNFTILHSNINNYNFNIFFLKNFKNFFNAVRLLLSFNFKFLSFDLNEKSIVYKNLLFSDLELLRYNFFFSNFFKVLKKQSSLHFYKSFFKINKIKFIIILDYEYYFNFLSYFNLLRISIFALIPYNYNNLYADFFLLFNKNYGVFYKLLFYSYILYIINFSNTQKNKAFKNQFFKKIDLIK